MRLNPGAHPRFPYLLKGVAVVRPNQVWSTDLTHIPLRGGFVFLAAILDWYSRSVLAWELSITREADFCVALLDFNHFLSLYALDKLPTSRRLRVMMNAFVFCVEGYDDDPREIHSIPEVGRFYAAFHEAWPDWLYFCNLEVDTLKAMVPCCLREITASKVDGRAGVGVQWIRSNCFISSRKIFCL